MSCTSVVIVSVFCATCIVDVDCQHCGWVFGFAVRGYVATFPGGARRWLSVFSSGVHLQLL